MTTSEADEFEQVDRLADEFAELLRCGGCPSISEYVAKYPHLSGHIQELFPALVQVEAAQLERFEMASPTAIPPSLKQIEDYRLLRELGRGGMGVVYEAEQVSLGRRVALKVISRQLARDARGLIRFRREARAAGRLHHTNIVPVYDFGQNEEVCYYAMQLIEGEGLDRIIVELQRITGANRSSDGQAAQTTSSAVGDASKSPLSLTGRPLTSLACSLLKDQLHGGILMSLHESSTVREGLDLPLDRSAEPLASMAEPSSPGHPSPDVKGAIETVVQANPRHYFRSVVRIGRQVAAALAYAHARGIIHRDIKPANLLLDVSGVVWISDFGLAKMTEENFTNSFDVVGTIRYMAPERFAGQCDDRSDIYSLGLTLYELLALRPAFCQGDRLQLIQEMRTANPAAPRQLDPRIPRDLETVVLKAIDRDPRRRYASADAMGEDLRRILADEPILARRTGPWGKLRLWARRNRLLAASLLLSIACLALVAVGSTMAAFVLRSQRDEANYFRHQSDMAELDRQHRSWESYTEAARGLRMSRSPGQRFEALDAIRQALKLPVPPGRSRNELRTEAVAALCLPDLVVAREMKLAENETVAGLDREMTRYATFGSKREVVVKRVADDSVVCRLPSAARTIDYDGIRFSADPRFVGHFDSTNCLRNWRIDGTAPKLIFAEDCLDWDFDPSGGRVAVYSDPATLEIRGLEDGRVLERITVSGVASGSSVRWSPCGRFIFVGMRLWDWRSRTMRDIDLKLNRISWVTWRRDGKVLALCEDGTNLIHLWDVARAKPYCDPVLPSVPAGGGIAAINARGDRLLATNWYHELTLFDLPSGRKLLSLAAGESWLGFSTDEQRVGADITHAECRLFRFSSGREVRYLRSSLRRQPTRAINIFGPGIVSLDGRWMMLGYGDFSTRCIDLESGLFVGDLELPGLPIGFEQDGSLLTQGTLGVLRWPITATGDQASQIGPPRQVADLYSGTIWAFHWGKRLIVVPRFDDATWLGRIDIDGIAWLRKLDGQRDVRSSAISPDGRWVVTASHSADPESGGRVWNAETGECVRKLPIEFSNANIFSPDGQWFLTLGGKPRLWNTQDWSQGPKLDLEVMGMLGCFSADSTMLALTDEPGYVRLFRVADGKELARLALSEPTRFKPLHFRKDGDLVLAGVEGKYVYLLDLALIRHGLVELGLDWEAEGTSLAYSKRQQGRADNEDPTPPSPPLAFDLGELGRAWQLDRRSDEAIEWIGQNQYGEAIESFRWVLARNSMHARANNGLASLLAGGPPDLRDSATAVSLARCAVDSISTNPAYWNTLGVAQYRNHQWSKAVRALEESQRLAFEPAELNTFYLAMCLKRLGEPARAEQILHDANESLQATNRQTSSRLRTELNAAQREALQVVMPP